jgi:hypothetical protein
VLVVIVLVAVLVTVTVALGTAAPEASVTRPEIEPRNSCALTRAPTPAKSTKVHRPSKTRLKLNITYFLLVTQLNAEPAG